MQAYIKQYYPQIPVTADYSLMATIINEYNIIIT